MHRFIAPAQEKLWALALCRRLGLEDRLVRTDDRFRRTFVWHGGRLHPLPDGFQLLAPTRITPLLTSSLFSWPGKLLLRRPEVFVFTQVLVPVGMYFWVKRVRDRESARGGPG